MDGEMGYRQTISRLLLCLTGLEWCSIVNLHSKHSTENVTLTQNVKYLTLLYKLYHKITIMYIYKLSKLASYCRISYYV